MQGSVRATFARGFYPPKPSRFVIALLRHLGRAYLRFGRGTKDLRIYNTKPLYEAFRRFYRGEARIILLFRHVEVADGPVIMTALTGDLRRATRTPKKRRRLGIEGPPLPRKPHAFFLYGKDVLNWAGAGARWLFPRLGGIPVVNTRLDRASHDAIRSTITHGDHPLALAPEGQVTYHMFHVSELAAGVGTMTRWVEEDLAEEPQDIFLVPMAIGYHLAKDHQALARSVLEDVYAHLGKETPRFAEDSPTIPELFAATDAVVGWLEDAYASAYPSLRREPGPSKRAPQEVAYHETAANKATPSTATSTAAALRRRVEALCDDILRVSELGQGSGDGSTFRRLFGTRYRATDLLYREDVDPQVLSVTDRAWADFRALDATTMDRHSQIVDVLMYLRPAYLTESKGPGGHRRAEYALNLLDVINRIEGGNINSRYSPRKKEARLLIGDVIDAGALLRGRGASSKPSPKEAIGNLNRSIHKAFVNLSQELEVRLSSERRTGRYRGCAAGASAR